jgi:hypothetical protein
MLDREVVVLIEVPKRGPATIRRGSQTWQQYLSKDMIAEIGPGRSALYMAYRSDDAWLLGRRMDVVMGRVVAR